MPTFCVFSKAAIDCHVLTDVKNMDYMRYDPARFVSVIQFTGKMSVKKLNTMLMYDCGLVGLLGNHIKVKKASNLDSRNIDIMKGIRRDACVTEYAHHYWLVKDGVPLSDEEKDMRFQEMVYWYMQSFSGENGKDMNGWVVMLGHTRFRGQWLVTSFADDDLFKKKCTLEESVQRLNKEFDTEFEVVFSKYDKDRCAESASWVHTLTNDFAVDDLKEAFKRLKPFKGGEKTKFVKVQESSLYKLKTMVEDDLRSDNEGLDIRRLKDLVKGMLTVRVKEVKVDEAMNVGIQDAVIEILD